MILSTKVRAQGGSLVTSIPETVVHEMRLAAGSEVFWVKDGQGGYRVFPDSAKARTILEAHEEEVDHHSDVFRDLAG
jgi:antitoxin component of MazEF toxin-antitoxin module